MAGFNGRQLTIDWDSTTLVGVQSKTMSMTNDLVDVTTDDDSGWRTLLADPGLKSLELSVSGITSDEVLYAEFFNANVTGETLTMTLPVASGTAGTVSGNFMLSSFEPSGEHDGAYEFSATFMSSGEIIYTASTA